MVHNVANLRLTIVGGDTDVAIHAAGGPTNFLYFHGRRAYWSCWEARSFRDQT
jgi:hypothetical protein